MGTNKSDKITHSPTLPDTDDEGGDIEWPVHGIWGLKVHNKTVSWLSRT